MQKIFRKIILVSMISCTFLFSCKKKETEPTPVKQNDQTSSVAADGAINDVNDYINNHIGGGSNQRIAALDLPCGVVKLDSSTSGSTKVYTLSYGSQTPCGYSYKSGQVAFHLVNERRFDTAGAVFAIQFINYTVQGNASGDVVTVNGTLFTTNITGGYVWQVITQGKPSVEHSIRGTLTSTYANGASRVREYYQHRKWSSTNGWAGLSFVVSGDTTISNFPVSEIGKTYDGNYDYQTQMLTPFGWSNCGTDWKGPYILKTGQARMNVNVPNITPAFFQVDAGYQYDVNTFAASIPIDGCNANAYKITVSIGTTNTTEYQLY